MAGSGNVVQPQLLKVADAGRLRRGPLATDDLDLGAARVPEDDRQIAARAVEMRLDNLEDKPGGDGRIELRCRRARGWPSRSVTRANGSS